MTGEMTRDEMAAYLNEFQDPKATEERLVRTDYKGTSLLIGGGLNMDGPWRTERCDKCGNFHHEFVPPSSNQEDCSHCGEPKDHGAHREPCSS